MGVKSEISGPGIKGVALYDSHTDTPVRLAVVEGITRVPVSLPSNALNDQWLNIASGAISGITGVNKFGRNSDVAQDGTEEIWDGSAAYVYPATALMTSMSQTVDQAAMQGETIEIQGLDATWTAVTQEVALNGSNTTTAVTLTTPLIRCFRMKVLADVVGDSPIRVHNVGETQDYAIISPGNNQTKMAVYTVPLGKTAYMVGYYANLNPAAAVGPTSCTIKMAVRDNANSYEAQCKSVLGLDPDATSHFFHEFKPYLKIDAQSDIFVTAAPTGKAADISAGFDLILVDD